MFQLIYLSVLVTIAFGSFEEDDPSAIINGNLANIEDFPYYAFLATGTKLHCGGAFIERDLVLTAAHCLGGWELRVYPGVTALRDVKHAKGYAVKSTIPHPRYFEGGNSAFDIGLIRLDKKIELGDKAQLIELATEAPPVGEEASVVGFGAVKCKGLYRCHRYSRSSKHLRSADILITSVEENGIVRTRSKDNKSTCYGDSGGPIAYDGKVIGVVSSGEFGDCTGYDIQGPVFTMLDWIEETKAKM